MHDTWLIAFAMAVAALGITLLLAALMFLEPPLAQARDVAQAADGTPQSVRGQVIAVRARGNVTTITLLQNATLDLILFDANASVREHDCIIASGKKSSYHGDAQLSVARIRRC